MTTRSRPFLVQAVGSPREVGEAHGRAAKALVGENIALYFRRFREEWGLSREAVLDRARRYERVIRDTDESYTEAMEGVARGSVQDLRDIVALNARYEIVYSAYSERGRAEVAGRAPSGCTALAILPERTAKGHLIMAQNWDWISGVRGIVLETHIEGRPGTLGFTEAGIVGAKIGLNDAGVGLLINGLVSNLDAWDRLGMPFHVRCGRILQTTGLDEAVRTVREPPGSCSSNFLIGYAGNDAARVIDLEASPAGVAEIPPERGVLVHANHFCRARELGVWEPLLEERTSTYLRHRRMEELVTDTTRRTPLSLEDVKSYLRDHEGRPNSICRHPETERSPSEWYETVASIILDVSARRFMMANGSPCEKEYAGFRLTKGRGSPQHSAAKAHSARERPS